MTGEEFRMRMEKIYPGGHAGDLEISHGDADMLMMQALRELDGGAYGHWAQGIEIFNQADKWYA